MSKDFIDRLAKVLFLANLTNEEKSSLDKTPSNINKDSSLEDIAALLMKIIPSYVDPVNVKEDSPKQVWPLINFFHLLDEHNLCYRKFTHILVQIQNDFKIWVLTENSMRLLKNIDSTFSHAIEWIFDGKLIGPERLIFIHISHVVLWKYCSVVLKREIY